MSQGRGFGNRPGLLPEASLLLKARHGENETDKEL